MLSTIVDDLLAREPDILVVSRSADGVDALRKAHEDQADLLITQENGGGGDGGLEAILAAPPLDILAISRDGRSGAAISLVRRPIDLGSNGGASLAAAIRALAEGR